MVGSKRHLVTEEKLKFGSSETDRERERERERRKKERMKKELKGERSKLREIIGKRSVW